MAYKGVPSLYNKGLINVSMINNTPTISMTEDSVQLTHVRIQQDHYAKLKIFNFAKENRTAKNKQYTVELIGATVGNTLYSISVAPYTASFTTSGVPESATVVMDKLFEEVVKIGSGYTVTRTNSTTLSFVPPDSTVMQAPTMTVSANLTLTTIDPVEGYTFELGDFLSTEKVNSLTRAVLPRYKDMVPDVKRITPSTNALNDTASGNVVVDITLKIYNHLKSTDYKTDYYDEFYFSTTTYVSAFSSALPLTDMTNIMNNINALDIPVNPDNPVRFNEGLFEATLDGNQVLVTSKFGHEIIVRTAFVQDATSPVTPTSDIFHIEVLAQDRGNTLKLVSPLAGMVFGNIEYNAGQGVLPESVQTFTMVEECDAMLNILTFEFTDRTTSIGDATELAKTGTIVEYTQPDVSGMHAPLYLRVKDRRDLAINEFPLNATKYESIKMFSKFNIGSLSMKEEYDINGYPITVPIRMAVLNLEKSSSVPDGTYPRSININKLDRRGL